MARDAIGDRFEKKKKQAKLDELARRGLSTEEVEAEQAALAKAREERRKDPGKYQISADQTVGRNDPCPCGSGKKYKKCCGAK
ncbi:MAG TPA: SEC-C metal-binding domain-containing protein [Phycisphaerae bacterium]|nr:SEC-C metal-binding domain-containing protein [Phycisphaerae bacterium]